MASEAVCQCLVCIKIGSLKVCTGAAAQNQQDDAKLVAVQTTTPAYRDWLNREKKELSKLQSGNEGRLDQLTRVESWLTPSAEDDCQP